MKPTLFMEDITFTDVLSADSLSSLSIVQHMLARVLPRRCPTARTVPPAGHLPTCIGCSGAGFLYPPTPDDWDDDPSAIVVAGWRWFCNRLWHTLGIVDD